MLNDETRRKLRLLNVGEFMIYYYWCFGIIHIKSSHTVFLSIAFPNSFCKICIMQGGMLFLCNLQVLQGCR